MTAFCTRKRHICWSNTSNIGLLDRGKLSKSQRESCIVKTTSKKKNGKATFSGNKFLKGTQPATQFLQNLCVDQLLLPNAVNIDARGKAAQVLPHSFWVESSPLLAHLLPNFGEASRTYSTRCPAAICQDGAG